MLRRRRRRRVPSASEDDVVAAAGGALTTTTTTTTTTPLAAAPLALQHITTLDLRRNNLKRLPDALDPLGTSLLRRLETLLLRAGPTVYSHHD